MGDAADLLKIKVARRFIKRIIRDLGSTDEDIFLDAELCLHSEVFNAARKTAGYPKELLDTLDSLVSVSGAGRQLFSRELIAHLKAEWEAEE